MICTVCPEEDWDSCVVECAEGCACVKGFGGDTAFLA